METLEKQITKEITTENQITQLNNTIEKYLLNLQKINLNSNFPQKIEIVKTPQDFIEVIKLRSKIFSQVKGFNQEYPEKIPGFQYDIFDPNSIILIHKTNKRIDGTIRLILDSKIGIQSEHKFSTPTTITNLRKQYNPHTNPLAELTRLAISQNARGQKLTQKLISCCANLSFKLDVGTIISAPTIQTFYKFFNPFEMEIIDTHENYGHLNYPGFISKWDKKIYKNHQLRGNF